MLIAPPASLVSLLEPWSAFYGDSTLTQTVVRFGHLGGLLVAGGIAVATDRSTLRAAAWADSDRRQHLAERAVLHRTVIGALVATIISGLLLLTADFGAYWGSWVFWVKMLLVSLLLGNGAWMHGVEGRLQGDSSAASPHWSALRTSAYASIALWITITLAGAALINYV